MAEKEHGTFQDLNNTNREKLRGGRARLPKGPKKVSPPGRKEKKAPLKTSLQQEKKYQMLKLIYSGRTLKEGNARAKAVSVGLSPEYLAKRDEKDLSAIEHTLDRLTRSRAEARDLAKLRFMPRSSFPINKEEYLARWILGQNKRQAINWKRDGNLVAKGPPTPSRPGSSRGKIGKTRVIGAKEVKANLKELVRTIRRFLASGNKPQAALKKGLKEFKVRASFGRG